MTFFKTQASNLSTRVFKYSLTRIGTREVDLMNKALRRHVQCLPSKVTYVGKPIPYDRTMDFYLFFCSVYNASCYILKHKLQNGMGLGREFEGFTRKLNQIADIHPLHLGHISDYFGRDAKEDFLLD